MSAVTEQRTTTRALPARRGRTTDRHARRGVADWVTLALAVLVGIAVVAPLILILLNSFKSPDDYAANGPLSLPTHVYLHGIVTFWDKVDFLQKLGNSVVICGLVAVFGVLFSVLNAYALGVGKVRGRIPLLMMFLLANMVPQEALLYPLYYMAKAVGLYDSIWAVIIIFTVIQCAFGTYLLSSVFAVFPKELLEAAAIDGAGRWRTLWRVLVPMSRPTLSVLLVFFFIWTWNEFLIPLTFLVSNSHQTVPIAIASLQGDRIMDITTTSASALLGLIPTLLFFLFFQRTLTRGITAGAIK